MNRDEVLKLAKLARIEISGDEADSLSHEFDSILKYVGEIKKANIPNVSTSDLPVRNVFREDTDPHESGIYTEGLLAEAPQSEGGYVRVKKIL